MSTDEESPAIATEFRERPPNANPAMQVTWNPRGQVLVNGRVLLIAVCQPKDTEHPDCAPVCVDADLMQRGPIGVLTELRRADASLAMIFTQRFQTTNSDEPKIKSFSQELEQHLRGRRR